MEPQAFYLAATQGVFNPSLCAADPQGLGEFFKVSVVLTQILRSTADQITQPIDYFVTSSGLQNSLRSPQDGFVNIGRQQINEEGKRPNDITLPASDRAISRCHCRLDYRQFFRARSLPEEYVAFLMAGHPRLGEYSAFRCMPPQLFGYIYTFLKAPYSIWLIDLGSVCGTYVKVSNDIPTELSRGQTFLIGSDICIDIDEVCNYPLSSVPSEGPEDSLTPREVSQPSIKITIGRIPDNEESTLNRHSQLFLAERPQQSFMIGRSNNCDIKLNDSTISRVQCRVIFSQDRWIMLDGTDGKSSVNGTWLSVCKRDRKVREESLPFPVTNGMQVKISEAVLQVTWPGSQ